MSENTTSQNTTPPQRADSKTSGLTPWSGDETIILRGGDRKGNIDAVVLIAVMDAMTLLLPGCTVKNAAIGGFEFTITPENKEALYAAFNKLGDGWAAELIRQRINERQGNDDEEAPLT